MKKMKKLKKLSLENELKKEAEQIEKKVREDKSLDDITVSDEMEKELFNKIQDYEYDKRHKKVVRKKKKSKLVIGALAAVLILVCGSVGSKSYWKTLWNKEAGDETLSYVDVENMETMETEDIDELEVDKEITKVMGASLVKMQYKPKEMVLKRYIIDKEQRMVVLFYQYRGEVIKYYMYTNSTDSSFGEKTVDQLLDEYEFQNGKHSILVKQYEIKDSDEERYIAEFEYKDIHYQIKGTIEKEEFEKILENLFFM